MGIRYENLPPKIKELIDQELAKAPKSPQERVLEPEKGKAPGERTTRLERDEQRVFAAWCKRHGLALVWHSTAKASTATPGCPDFIVAREKQLWWIEFKLEGERLSKVQEEFKGRLESAGFILHVVNTADQAIKLIKDNA